MESANAMELPIDDPDSSPHVHRAELDEPAGRDLARRLRGYLSMLSIPEALASEWIAHAQRGGADAGQAFARLRMLMADHWAAGEPGRDGMLADAEFRLCRWLASDTGGERPDCPLQIDSLFELPAIRRRPMLPESWDD
ncbi:hypothetical protein [Acidihalobacter prosperus]|uniref:Uncharacterized protein n=1 Tax=Acidihalobacter prosperus TaxID=160660 RepID=A0A1A6C6L4_9GAMM|nr:hypothetical protein [Acidihalobacter prosperus]OBS10201.1 hypothetical protein Thpro_021251 [Acidihalobacter prosperus]